eukprot:TRINITY_DN5821_c1_g1_i1.p4 TRINITY_DN5821_c1_g1~~TRINITY_DN5821_c1_g1_i1.p4  ORF type:complete len:105 (-),score=3.95 TRINITY_DN5821_c1_g1_i1:364-639(-)
MLKDINLLFFILQYQQKIAIDIKNLKYVKKFLLKQQSERQMPFFNNFCFSHLLNKQRQIRLKQQKIKMENILYFCNIRQKIYIIQKFQQQL